MGDSSSSKCAVASGDHDGRWPVRDDIRLDGKWEHQRVHQGAQGCESVRACTVLPLLLTAITTDDPLDSSKMLLGD